MIVRDGKKQLLGKLDSLFRKRMPNDYKLRRAVESALTNPSGYSDSQLVGLMGLIESSLRRNSGSVHIFDSSSYPVMNGFRIGRAIDTGKIITISDQIVNMHCFLAGSSGTGKTNLLNVLLAQVPQFSGLRYLVVDLKDDYKVHLKLNKDVLVLNWNELKLNPLRPPKGVNYLYWLNIYIDVFCDIFCLAISSKGGLLENLANLYQEFGVDKGSENYPSLFVLKDFLSRVQFSSSMQVKALKNRLSTILLTTGKVFDCSEGFSLEKLTSTNLIIRLHGLAEELQNFFLVYILVWLFNHRVYNGIRNRGLSLLVLIDECKRLFAKTLEARTGSAISSLSDSISKVREFGIGIIAADQEISKISRSLLANTYTKIFFDLNLGQDQDSITKAVGLNSIQKEAYMRGLGIGRAILKSGSNPPCLVEIPYYRIKEAEVSEKEREDRMKPFLDDLYVDVVQVNKPDLIVPDDKKNVGDKKKDNNVSERVSERAKMLLSDVCSRPYEFVTQRMESLGMSPTTFSKLKKELLRSGFIEETTIKTGDQRGKKAKFLIPTASGYELLGKKPLSGKGGAKHRFYAGAVMVFLRNQGYKSEIEFFHNGKAVDIGYIDEKGELIAVEITCSMKNILDNVEKDLKAGFSMVTFVFDDTSTEKKAEEVIEKSVSGDMRQRLRLHQISQYF